MSFFIDEVIKEIEDTKRGYYCFTILADEKVKALQKALKKTDYCILQVNYYGVFQVIVGRKQNANCVFDFHHLYCVLCCSDKYTPRYVDINGNYDCKGRQIISVNSKKSGKPKFLIYAKNDKITKIKKVKKANGIYCAAGKPVDLTDD